MRLDEMRVLVVDDDRTIRRYLRAALSSAGYQSMEVASGKEALQVVHAYRPQLIILDLILPDTDGIQITRQLRAWTEVPILILSSNQDESDKINALDAGADDYLTKPFGVGELLARIRLAMRHAARTESQSAYRFGNLTIDPSRRAVILDGCELALSRPEYEILRRLAEHPNQVVSVEQLQEALGGSRSESAARMVAAIINLLRQKIEPDPQSPVFLLSEADGGYRLSVSS
jgi:two-component system KDP operon response regulator KdpE